MFKTYVINLESSKVRKEYMTNILKEYSLLDIEYIKAIDGRKLSSEEKDKYFDSIKFKKRNSINVRDGEIGCTLSHQFCYRKIVDNNIPFALILEDDIEICDDINSVLQNISSYIETNVPTVILLSGWYWYTSKKNITATHKLANVYDAFLTHSYIINKSAAKLLIEKKPFITADDWFYIKNKGVKIKALLPHVINQRWDGSMETTVNTEKKETKTLIWKLKNSYRLVFTKILNLFGHFEEC